MTTGWYRDQPSVFLERRVSIAFIRLIQTMLDVGGRGALTRFGCATTGQYVLIVAGCS